MTAFRVLFACGVLFGAAACGSDEAADTTATPTEATEVVVTTEAEVVTTGAAPPTEVPATVAATTVPAPVETAAAELEGTLTVMAPGPFTKVLEAAAAEFVALHPGVTVETNLGHVPTLLTQLAEGVVADVLITPDAGTMGQAVTKGLTATDPSVFAKVPMALVVPAGNAAGVTGVEALADETLRVAVCATELPCGKLAEQLAANAGITISVDTLETGGSPGVVTKASTGEIDVGLVFATDIAAGGDKVEPVTIPVEVNVASDASIAPLSVSDDPEIAAAFVAFMTSAAGTDLVLAQGFLAP